MDPDLDQELYPKEPELESIGSGNMLESDTTLESAPPLLELSPVLNSLDLFWRFISLILIQESPSVRIA